VNLLRSSILCSRHLFSRRMTRQFSDRVRAPRDCNSCAIALRRRTTSFDTEQRAMVLRFP
jgi:hypothetical protein